jgi:hypothetical protein
VTHTLRLLVPRSGVRIASDVPDSHARGEGTHPRRTAIRAALSTAREAPFTVSLVIILLATTIALRSIGPSADDVLEWASTNVHNLNARPIESLIASAVFLPDEIWLPYAVVLAIALVPLERRFGTLTTIAIFLSGHVLATLATEGPVALAIHEGWLAPRSADWLDVGVSYGMYASLAGASFLLHGRWRWGAAATMALGVLAALAIDPDMTSAGHVLSLAIGFAWWPLLARLPHRDLGRRLARAGRTAAQPGGSGDADSEPQEQGVAHN